MVVDQPATLFVAHISRWDADESRDAVRFGEIAHRVDVDPPRRRVQFGDPFGQFRLADSRHAGEEHHRGRFVGFRQARGDQPQFRSDFGCRIALTDDRLAQRGLEVAGRSFAADRLARQVGQLRHGTNQVRFLDDGLISIALGVIVGDVFASLPQDADPLRGMPLIEQNRRRQRNGAIGELGEQRELEVPGETGRRAAGDRAGVFIAGFFEADSRDEGEHLGLAADVFGVFPVGHDADDPQAGAAEEGAEQGFVGAAVGTGNQSRQAVQTDHQVGLVGQRGEDHLQARPAVFRADVRDVEPYEPTAVELGEPAAMGFQRQAADERRLTDSAVAGNDRLTFPLPAQGPSDVLEAGVAEGGMQRGVETPGIAVGQVFDRKQRPQLVPCGPQFGSVTGFLMSRVRRRAVVSHCCRHAVRALEEVSVPVIVGGIELVAAPSPVTVAGLMPWLAGGRSVVVAKVGIEQFWANR